MKKRNVDYVKVLFYPKNKPPGMAALTADDVCNFVVKDRGGLALVPEPEPEAVADTSAAEANGRPGSVSLWFLLVFL